MDVYDSGVITGQWAGSRDGRHYWVWAAGTLSRTTRLDGLLEAVLPQGVVHAVVQPKPRPGRYRAHLSTDCRQRSRRRLSTSFGQLRGITASLAVICHQSELDQVCWDQRYSSLTCQCHCYACVSLFVPWSIDWWSQLQVLSIDFAYWASLYVSTKFNPIQSLMLSIHF